MTPGSRQTGLLGATMPREIQRPRGASTCSDPILVKVKTPTLTVDTVEQFRLRGLELRRRSTRSSA